jgi:DNA-binding MarR family transcriptional regulator
MSRETRDDLIRQIGLEVRAQQNDVDLIDDAAFQLLGINRTDGRCLDVIDQHGRITAGDLARGSGLTSGAVTAVIDRLERAGHVRRTRDDEDRRRVYVEVTPRTQERLRDLYGPLAAASYELLGTYTVAELTLLRDFIRLGRERTREHAERLQALLRDAGDHEATIERRRPRRAT